MKRIPLLPTLIVGLAIAAMVALGLWQLVDRLPRKEAFLAQIARNPGKPPVAFPRAADETLLFRQSVGTCTPPVAVRLAGAGAAGYRAIATCADGMTVQLGTTRDPMGKPAWGGGRVTGRIGQAPDGRSLIGTLFDHRAPTPMLVADPPLAGLSPNAVPSVDAIPNNHLAYAGQWFFFAIVAGVIYVVALRRRVRAQAAGRG